LKEGLTHNPTLHCGHLNFSPHSFILWGSKGTEIFFAWPNIYFVVYKVWLFG